MKSRQHFLKRGNFLKMERLCSSPNAMELPAAIAEITDPVDGFNLLNRSGIVECDTCTIESYHFSGYRRYPATRVCAKSQSTPIFFSEDWTHCSSYMLSGDFITFSVQPSIQQSWTQNARLKPSPHSSRARRVTRQTAASMPLVSDNPRGLRSSTHTRGRPLHGTLGSCFSGQY